MLLPRVLYLFAGIHRKASIGQLLKKAGFSVEEVDICRGLQHDLSLKKNRDYYLHRIRGKLYFAVVTSPPCDTFSRAKFANMNGPAPTRSAGLPRGFKNLPPALHRKNVLGNILADFSYEAILAQLRSNPEGCALMEHPENLGRVQAGPYTNCIPASIWQWPEHDECVKAGASSVGLRQLDFGTSYVKPTRLIIKVTGPLPSTFFQGLPTFAENGDYVGPIPRTQGTTTLVRRPGDSAFRTTGTAAWPEDLCKTLCGLLQASILVGVPSTLQESPAQEIPTFSFPPCPFIPATPSEAMVPASSASSADIVQMTCTEASDQVVESFPVHLPCSNHWVGGLGPCRNIKQLGKSFDYHDGGGLTSPGRWNKECRNFPKGLRWTILRNQIESVLANLSELEVQKQFIALALGKQHLFDSSWPMKIRETLHVWLGKQAGDYNAKKEVLIDEGQPFCLDLIHGLLKEARDGDYEIFKIFKTGVTTGIIRPLPRTPAIFEEQKKWRLQFDPFEIAQERNDNYMSLDDHVGEVRRQFLEDEKLYRMKSFNRKEFEERYPVHRSVSALAVLQEKDKIRVLHDASNVVLLNHKIKCRDKLRNPGPREKFLLLKQFKKHSRQALSIIVDVSKAHRLVKHLPDEHGLLACALPAEPGAKGFDDGFEYWVNCVGTFGVGSAAYWWTRLFSGPLRLLYLLLGPGRQIDALCFADDLEMIAETGLERRWVLLGLCILIALGTPIKWSKVRGGWAVDWVGLHTNYKEYGLGLSISRALWLTVWLRGAVKEGVVDVGDFLAATGRLNFAARALVYERPFLGIIYSWISTVFRTKVKRARLPWAIALVVGWIARWYAF